MRAGEKEMWRAELPFTLCEALVSDDGVTVGYAYSHGLEGGTSKEGPGSLQVVIIDAAGAVRLQERLKRKHSGALHASPEPVAKGCIVHPRDDRFTLRVAADRGENWRVYRLSTGELVKRFELRATAVVAESARYVLGARAVEGRPLTLVQWWHSAGEKRGALFTLCDLDGRTVWSWELPDDYTVTDDEEAESRLWRRVRESGAILSSSVPGSFDVWSAAAGERIRFEILNDGAAPTGWAAREVAREKYAPPPEDQPRPVIEQRPLPHLGSFVLRDQPPPTPIRGIREFAFDGVGRLGFLRRDDLAGNAFVLLESSGRVLAEITLPATADANLHLAWIAEARWLVTVADDGIEAKARGWWLDVETRTQAEIAEFDCPAIESVAGTGDGGFVALATRRQRNSMSDHLIGFDSIGKRRWKRDAESSLEPAALFSPEAITVTTRNEIAVVDNIRDTVQLFTTEGAHLRTIDLKKAWQREPNYPSAITPDIDGGFIVYDFGANPPFVRMKPDGMTRGVLRPRHASGRAIDAHTGLCAAPDGSLWASDGHCFAQLNARGVATRIVGSPPDDSSLGEIAAIAGDQRGQLYAVEARTGAVHVFDSEGTKLRVCKPAKGDFAGNAGPVQVAAADDGAVVIDIADFGTPRYLRFAPDGKRLGIARFDVDAIKQEWHPQPGTTNLLVLGFRGAFLVDRAGKTLRKIDRRSDLGWLDLPSDATFASDGSFAILSSSSEHFGREQRINFFTRDAEAIGLFSLPGGFVQLRGFNGRHVTLSTAEDILIYARDGTALQRFPGPSPRGAWDHFLTHDGRELWVVEFATREIERYAMP